MRVTSRLAATQRPTLDGGTRPTVPVQRRILEFSIMRVIKRSENVPGRFGNSFRMYLARECRNWITDGVFRCIFSVGIVLPLCYHHRRQKNFCGRLDVMSKPNQTCGPQTHQATEGSTKSGSVRFELSASTDHPVDQVRSLAKKNPVRPTRDSDPRKQFSYRRCKPPMESRVGNASST